VHWSIGRPGLAGPTWSNEGTGDERVAYLAGSTLRVIGGDGRGDRLLARNVAHVVPAWRRGAHVLAYVDGAGRVVVRDADTGAVQWRSVAQQPPQALEWSGDGHYLLARGPSSITVFGDLVLRTVRARRQGGQPDDDCAHLHPKSHAARRLAPATSGTIT